MENQKFFSITHCQQKDDMVFYSEEDIPICVNVENLTLFDCKEDSQTINFGNDVQVLSEAVEELQTLEVPSTPLKIPKRNDHYKKPAKRWCQKDVSIKTIESEFKVTMWVLDDTNPNEQDLIEPTFEVKQIEFKQESIVSNLEQQFEISELSHQNNVLPKIKHKDLKKIHKNYLTQNGAEQPNMLKHFCTFENCLKAFKNISSLRKHFTTHGPKTKVCAECGKAFIDNSKLNRHLIVHTGDKPFQCSFAGCGKRFSLDFNLRTHARIHTGYRPFACTIDGCTKRFAQSTNLKSHQMIHLKKSIYKLESEDSL